MPGREAVSRLECRLGRLYLTDHGFMHCFRPARDLNPKLVDLVKCRFNTESAQCGSVAHFVVVCLNQKAGVACCYVEGFDKYITVDLFSFVTAFESDLAFPELREVACQTFTECFDVIWVGEKILGGALKVIRGCSSIWTIPYPPAELRAKAPSFCVSGAPERTRAGG